jgi:protein-tyrosine phosphatase
MAEGLLKDNLPPYLGNYVEVSSAGTNALHGHHPHRHAIAAMAQIGINIKRHRAKQITRDIARNANLILVMETTHANHIKTFLSWGKNNLYRISEFDSASPTQDIEDPYGKSYIAYERCIKVLRPCVRGVTHWLNNKLM